MACQVAKTSHAASGLTLATTANASVSLNAINISFVCNGSAPCNNYYSGSDSEGRRWYHTRGSFSVASAFGIKKQLKQSISLYKGIHVEGANSIIAAFRTGAPNNTSTNINTATILQSGNANTMTINIADNQPYLVLGNSYSVGGASGTGQSNSVSVNYNATITEIWLE